jgi:hypothetical protein
VRDLLLPSDPEEGKNRPEKKAKGDLEEDLEGQERP